MPEVKCFVLQKEVRPGDRPLHDTRETPDRPPKTVLVIDENPDDPAYKFRDHTRDGIVAKSDKYWLPKGEGEYFWGVVENGKIVPTKFLHHVVEKPNLKPTGLVVPDLLVKELGIVSGDKVNVHINEDEHLVTIVSVNGVADFSKFRTFPRKGQLGPNYPRKLIPLGAFSHTLRVMELLAPVGFGQCNFTLGPGGSGKTYALLDVVRASLILSKNHKNLYVIVVYVGDRGKDVGLYQKVRQLTQVEERAEFYIGDETVPAANQYSMMRFAIDRAWELARQYDVILVIDSLSRAVFAHSFGGYADKDSGMIRGGIYTASLEQVGRDVGGAGYFESTDTSLTIFSSLLFSTDRGASAIVQFARDTMDNKPDCIWTFMNNPSLRTDELEHEGYPWASVHDRESYTRKSPEWLAEHFVPDELQEEIDAVRERWKFPVVEDNGYERSPRSEDRHFRLVQFAEQNPKPKYVVSKDEVNS